MKTMHLIKFPTSALVVGLMASGAAHAVDVAGDNFDTSVLGTDYASRSFSPDNSGNISFGGAPGVFAGSDFDVFGITNRNVNFDFADDSAGGFAADNQGFAGIGANDPGNFVGVADTINNNNNNPVTATWTFDIAGFENLALGIDFVGYGDFEDSDTYIFQASIDGGTPIISHQVGMTPAQDDADTLYTIDMDGGATVDRSTSPFFDADEHQFLLDNAANILANGPQPFDPGGGAPIVTIGFSTADDGATDGDTTANDGTVPVTGALGTMDDGAYQVQNAFGTFQQTETVPYSDPLFVLSHSDTQLDGDLTTFITNLAGTGDELTLTFTGSSNGGGETFAFDNILITGDAIGGTGIVGDYDDSGQVEQTDLDFVLQNWGDTDISDVTGWVNFAGLPGGGIDGQVEQTELDGVLQNWGSTSAPDFSGSSVPEPTTLAILAGLGVMGLRRRA